MTGSVGVAPDIKPCPFCGSKNVAFVKLCYGEDGINGYIKCHDCHACSMRDEKWKVILNWNIVSDGASIQKSYLDDEKARAGGFR